MKGFKQHPKMSHSGNYCWGNKVMKKAKGGPADDPAADRLIGKQYDPKTSAVKKKIAKDIIPDEQPYNYKGVDPNPLGTAAVLGYVGARKLYNDLSGNTKKSDEAKKKLKDMDDNDYRGDSLGTPEEGYAAKEHAYKRGGAAKPFWKTKNPKKESKKLTPAQKASAKARAKKAGRPYPNLIDNAAASRRAK